MALERRELYSSPNGDRWFLSRDPGTGNIFIRHEANVPSGGHLTDISERRAKSRASSALAPDWIAG
jgi:hypothetical protein